MAMIRILFGETEEHKIFEEQEKKLVHNIAVLRSFMGKPFSEEELAFFEKRNKEIDNRSQVGGSITTRGKRL
jgi:hypothetical protein